MAKLLRLPVLSRAIHLTGISAMTIAQFLKGLLRPNKNGHHPFLFDS